MNASFTCLTCGYNGTGISSMISVDKAYGSSDCVSVAKVLINVGDSMLKFSLENKIKLVSINLIVLTSLAPHNTAGLPGLIHSLASLGVEKIVIIGPPGVNLFIQVVTPFVNRKYPEIESIEVSDDYSISKPYVYSSQYFDLKAFPYVPDQGGSVVALGGWIRPKASINDTSTFQEVIFMSYCDHLLLNPSPREIILSFSMYDTENIVAAMFPMSITDGLNLSGIKNDCFSDIQAKIKLLFTNQLSSDYVELAAAQEDLTVNHSVSSEYFPLGLPILNGGMSSAYSLPTNVFTAHPSLSCSLLKLNLAVSSNYISRIEELQIKISSKIIPNSSVPPLQVNLSAAQDQKIVENVNEVLDSAVQSNTSANMKSAANIRSSILNRFKKRKLTEESTCNIDTKSSIHITFLGTGSAAPSKHRNNSCVMLGCSNQIGCDDADMTYILLDVGEGTCCQIFQYCSGDRDKFYSILLNIRLIWVSHHHCDHIAGFPQLLEQIYRARMLYKEKSYDNLCIICPDIVHRYYSMVSCMSGIDDMITLIPMTDSLYAGMKSRISSITGGIVDHLQSVAVYHCHQSYGVILKISGIKLVYSGDCRPSESLIQCGKGCDILIHEATFDDSMCSDAEKKKHSTVSEALSVASKMICKHLVLTHFSQRYITSAPEGHTTTSMRYVAALDFLSFRYPEQFSSLEEWSMRRNSTSESFEETTNTVNS